MPHLVRIVWGRIAARIGQSLGSLDSEKVSTFQTMYYVVFTAFAASLLFAPCLPEQDAARILRPFIYHAWLAMNLVCPSMTLIGRKLTTRSASVAPGEPSPALGAAWLQLAGDMGVWGSVLLWCGVMIQSTWWHQNLFVAYFMLMGVLGGAMFTARSARRMIAIGRKSGLAGGVV